MRLLHTKTYRLHEYFNNEAPHYAILSHTWEGKEVTYEEIRDATDPSAIDGFAKIQGACALADSEGFEFIWIDTCCINKSNSSELSEAINSMYLWYQRAAVCYAYLAGVESQPQSSSNSCYAFQTKDLLFSHPRFAHFEESNFRNSRWFERGWTLQELIAPSVVIFCSQDWRFLGTKLSLKPLISSITGIEEIIITSRNLDIFSVARKMSWASKRITTRKEDMAYCLLGIFSVNMPLLYGEGQRSAFIRLQEHIIARSNDQSILAWTVPQEKGSHERFYGLLAPFPKAFEHTGKQVSLLSPMYRKQRTIKVVNSTIEAGVILRQDDPTKHAAAMSWEITGFKDREADSERRYFNAVLDCQIGNAGDCFAGIEIKVLNPQDGRDGRVFARTKPHSLEGFSMKGAVMTGRAYHAVHGGPPPSQEFIASAVDRNMLSWRAFWYSCYPWELETISVPHNPQYPKPRGFSLQLDDRIFSVSHFPSDRWFNHDRILLLSSYTQIPTGLPIKQGVTTEEMDYLPKKSLKYEHSTWVEGILHIDLKQENSETVVLVLGMRVQSLRGQILVRMPWCRLISLKNLKRYSNGEYQINWGETYVSVIQLFEKLQVSVEKADWSGLFQVKLEVIN